MHVALIVGLILIFVLNLAADRVRNRVDVVRADQKLTVRNQQAAVRIDAITLAVCILALIYSLATRSTLLFIVAAVAAGAVGWRLWKARRAPDFTFDRAANLVWRDHDSICDLHTAAVGLVLVPGDRVSSLVLNYRDGQGQPRQELIHRASTAQVSALHAVVAEFLSR
jgi:hypothetical protein